MYCYMNHNVNDFNVKLGFEDLSSNVQNYKSGPGGDRTVGINLYFLFFCLDEK